VITREQALEILAGEKAAAAVEEIGLDGALGRVLARTVLSPIDSPPFDKSAMDGFAVGEPAAGQEGPWRVRETVAAGNAPTTHVQPGECARIMTGAMLPPGTTRVIRREFTEESGGGVRLARPETGDNVVRRGENLRAGEPVLHPRVLAAQDIGVLAASGIASIPVAVPPRVGILCTGTEIRSPGEPLGPGEIYNSSAVQLAAQLDALKVPSRFLGTVADRREALLESAEAGLASCDVLLLTGGVSEGDFDYVPGCLQEIGAEVIFHGVAIKPGKPTLFARAGEKRIFGLPGNPVSTFVIFEIFVKPLLLRLMGITHEPVIVRGPLSARISRRQADRDELRPVRFAAGAVEALSYLGSAHLNGLVGAQGLIRIDRGVTEIPAGKVVDVRLF
jgi:molybdopterin molybdotransferase